MRRSRRSDSPFARPEASEAKDLVDLAARMGIPPDDAVRQVTQLISDANQADADAARAQAGPRS